MRKKGSTPEGQDEAVLSVRRAARTRNAAGQSSGAADGEAVKPDRPLYKVLAPIFLDRAPHIAYRQQTETPTKEGWYYGRIREDVLREQGVDAPELKKGSIIPLFVNDWYGDGYLGADYSTFIFQLDEVDWFGPVAECREG